MAGRCTLGTRDASVHRGRSCPTEGHGRSIDGGPRVGRRRTHWQETSGPAAARRPDLSRLVRPGQGRGIATAVYGVSGVGAVANAAFGRYRRSPKLATVVGVLKRGSVTRVSTLASVPSGFIR